MTEVCVGENAIVDFYTDQRETDTAYHVANLQAHVSAQAATFALARGHARRRSSCATTSSPCWAARARTARSTACYLVDGERLVDNHTTIDHATPHCTSHELYKGILDGSARAVFNGRIIVRLDAQKTDAKQTNRALLLSDEAHDQLEPAARDLCRRCEVHAWRGDRPARRRGDVLSAGARPDAAARRATC